MCDDCFTREEIEEIVDQRVQEETADLREELQEERERRRELEQRVDDLEDDLEGRAALRWDSDDSSEATIESTDGTVYPLGRALKSKVGESDFQQGLEELEERLETGDLSGATGEETTAVETETPLEDVVSLPENIAEKELSENQLRARFIAKDITQYGEYKGDFGVYTLTSSDVDTILRSAFDVDHSETRRRVLEWLNELAGDCSSLKKRNGEKKLSIDADAARRLNSIGDLETHIGVREVPG